jgi:hypothetical protein
MVLTTSAGMTISCKIKGIELSVFSSLNKCGSDDMAAIVTESDYKHQ